MAAALNGAIVASLVVTTCALVPYPKFWNKTSSSILRTIHPGEFEIVTNITYLIDGATKRAPDWFRLPDAFIDYPVNPSEKELLPLNRIHVFVESDNTDLLHGVDESYELTIPATDGPATLNSKSVFGALRGLETFAQLLEYGWIEDNTGQSTFTLSSTPHTIYDAPSYPYRGLLVDTARHYLPMELLLTNLDAMSMNKLNVLHWHMTDSQSWPYQSQKYPELSQKGAFRPDLVYSAQDVQHVIQEAYYRGIRVIPEFDLPGHSYAIGKSHSAWMSHCPEWDEPIDPTNDEVYEFIAQLYDEIFSLFPSDMVHLGGDEVPLDCWEKDPAIKAWMETHNVTNAIDLYELFETKLLRIVEAKQPIVWQEVFDLGINISERTIIDVWKEWDGQDADTLFHATAAGYQVILSSCWYLDHLGDDWFQYYQCDPRAKFNGTDEQYALVLGGHASMWGEQVDSSNFMSRVWPRASSMSERLWSGEASDDYTIRDRMANFRCHMVRRGIDASPIGPGFCGKEPTFNNNVASTGRSYLRQGRDTSDQSWRFD